MLVVVAGVAAVVLSRGDDRPSHAVATGTTAPTAAPATVPPTTAPAPATTTTTEPDPHFLPQTPANPSSTRARITAGPGA